MLHVFDGHFDDFRLFDPAASFLHVSGWQETRQVGQAVVHPVAPSFLDDSMRLGITSRFGLFREGRVSFVILTANGRKVQVPAIIKRVNTVEFRLESPGCVTSHRDVVVFSLQKFNVWFTKTKWSDEENPVGKRNTVTCVCHVIQQGHYTSWWCLIQKGHKLWRIGIFP